jgi:hypothetical protein
MNFLQWFQMPTKAIQQISYQLKQRCLDMEF